MDEEDFRLAYERQTEELRQQIARLEAVAKQVLTKQALQRYANIKLVDPEKASQLLLIAAEAVQRGVKQIDDEEFKELLRKLTVRKDFRIRRR